jgi:hypothetical protein
MKILCPARSANGGWKAHAEGRLEDRLSQLAKPKLLIIESSAICHSSRTRRTCSSSSSAGATSGAA